MTLAEKIEAAKGRPAGFDYMRIMFALSVVCWHTLLVTYGYNLQEKIFLTPPTRIIVAAIVPMFFAFSGFLVAGSLERCKTLGGFLFMRILRIFPALVMDDILCAFILGTAMTQFKLGRYFHDPLFFSYLLNCLGDIHYQLPGLFADNPFPTVVNMQLWTVPFELECYSLLAILSVLGIIARPKIFLVLIAALACYGLADFLAGHDRQADDLHGNQLVLCFLIGVALYNFRTRIPYSGKIGLAALGACVICFWVPGGGLLAPLPITYLTVFLGLTHPKRLFFMLTGDYSYGIYLYGFPIQQAVAGSGLVPLNGALTLAVSLPIIVTVAALSWHFFELPFLALRRYRPHIDRLAGFTRPDAAWNVVANLIRPDRLRARKIEWASEVLPVLQYTDPDVTPASPITPTAI